MKTPSSPWRALWAVALVSAAMAQSKYSGVYSGKEASGPRFLAAITKGGRILGIDEQTRGIRNAIDPSKSTVNSSGKIKGATQTGASLVGSISSDFKISGTFKSSDGTTRLSGKRIYL